MSLNNCMSLIFAGKRKRRQNTGTETNMQEHDFFGAGLTGIVYTCFTSFAGIIRKIYRILSRP